jgi:hypothetical protein
MDLVKIKNPADGSIGETTREAFALTWEPRGWAEVGDDVRTTADEVSPVGPLDARPKADLVALAQANGVDDSGTKAELSERLRAAGLEN